MQGCLNWHLGILQKLWNHGVHCQYQAHLAIWKLEKFSILTCLSEKWVWFCSFSNVYYSSSHTSPLQRQVSIMYGSTGCSLVNGTILAVRLIHVLQNVCNLHPASGLPSQLLGNMFWSVSSECSQRLTQWGKRSMARQHGPVHLLMGDAVRVICTHLMTSQHLLTLSRERWAVEELPASLPWELGLDWQFSANGDCGGKAGGVDWEQDPFLQHSSGLWDGQCL